MPKPDEDLPLARPGVDDDQAFFTLFQRHDFIPRHLFLGHFAGMAGVSIQGVWRGHGAFRCLTIRVAMPQVGLRWFLFMTGEEGMR